MSNVHDKMRKLLALAERGEGGEKETAQRMLGSLLLKYGISLQELAEDSKNVYYWNYNNVHERKILFQIYCKVCNTEDIEYYTDDRKCGFELSSSQYIEMDLHYSILKKELKTLIERTVSAFVVANKIFANEEKDTQHREYTQKELEELEELLRIANCIKPSKINKQLERK